ncbi:MAG: 4Fe-4S dicluster domain-containing protein [Coriobacteriia bacterium]
MKVFIFDPTRCNGCHNCQIGCKDETVDNEWLPYSLPQPNVGQFWLKLDETTHGQVPKVRVEYRVKTCLQCDNAPCMAAAPDAVYKREDGIVIVDPVKAKGRRDLVDACPYGCIWWNEELEVPQKCTGCAHLLDEGEAPHCVDLCPFGAWSIAEEEDVKDILAESVQAGDPEHKGRLYYHNLPGLFIAGDVWDSEKDEIVEGAQVTLFSGSGKEIACTQTDNFGDFWFKKLEAGTYSVRIETVGYETATKEVDLTKSLNVGDFPLVRKHA